MASIPTVSIIGTAGRDFGDMLTPKLYAAMVRRANTIIRKDLGFSGPVDLVSGGAAMADHVAVSLFSLDESHLPGSDLRLTLHLPCEWVKVNNQYQFEDTGSADWRTNPGKLANYYHKKFCSRARLNSFAELQNAIEAGAETHIHKGFHARNHLVAASDVLIAFTWADGDSPDDGGTKHTWDKSTGKKIHVSLQSLV